jgi:hypothetical protein
MWRTLRGLGYPVVSTWIDEVEPNTMRDLWTRITDETRAAALVLYAPPENAPWEGAFVKVGMALGRGCRVFIAGPYEHLGSWVWAPGITLCADVVDALHAAKAYVDALNLE